MYICLTTANTCNISCELLISTYAYLLHTTWVMCYVYLPYSSTFNMQHQLWTADFNICISASHSMSNVLCISALQQHVQHATSAVNCWFQHMHICFTQHERCEERASQLHSTCICCHMTTILRVSVLLTCIWSILFEEDEALVSSQNSHVSYILCVLVLNGFLLLSKFLFIKKFSHY